MTTWFLISVPHTDIGKAELHAALHAVKSLGNGTVKTIKPENLADTRFSKGDTLWCHVPCEDVSSGLHTPEALQALRNAVEGQGVGLLLSLTGAILPVAMGLESVQPSVVEARRWRKETGNYAYRGFAAYDEHPLFNSPNVFRTRLFTWTPQNGEPYWRTIYRGKETPERIIARGTRYLSQWDDEGSIWEYRAGKGIVLCVGSYLYFNARRNYQRSYAEAFLANCLSYLSAGDAEPEICYYWPPRNIGVSEAPQNQRMPLPDINIRFTPEKYFQRPGLPSLESRPGNNYFSAAGRRMLVSGFEGDRLAEIWSYPVRVLKDFHWSIRPDGKGDIPARGMPSTTEVFPDAVIQQYEYTTYGVRELTGVHIFKPAAYMNLEIVAERPFSISLHFKVDLAMMWPMPDGSGGALTWKYLQKKRLLTVCSQFKHLWMALGLSIQPEEVHVRDTGNTDYSEAEVEIVFPLSKPGMHYLSIAILGGNGSQDIPNYDTELDLDSMLDLDRSADHYRNMEKTMFRAETPEEDINTGLRWAQLKMEAFRAVTPGLGRGLTAGLAASGEGWMHTRPGYGWYFGRDSLWTSLALLTIGQWNAAADSLRLLADQQAIDGKLFHELSPSNFAHHDSADANLLFLITAERYLAWTGDDQTIEEIKPVLLRALEFSFEADRDGDCLTENTGVGHGWIEGGKLSGAHVTFYLAGLWLRALEAAGRLFKNHSDKNLKRRIELNAVKAREAIHTRFRDEKRSTYFYGQAKDGHMIPGDTIMPSTAILFGVTEKKQDLEFLKRSSGPDIVSDWGARMISELDVRYNPLGYHMGSVWPLYTGWLGLAQYRYHRDLQGYDLLRGGMAAWREFSVGCFSEVLQGDIYEETGVCPQQAWSAALMIWLLTKGMLGFEAQPDGTILISPVMPPHWQEARFFNVRWSDGFINMLYQRTGTVVTWTIEGLDPGERLTFSPVMPVGSTIEQVTINGEQISANERTENSRTILEIPMVGDSNPARIEISLDRYFCPKPDARAPERGKPSMGFRIIDWNVSTDSAWVEVMGRSGVAHELVVVDPEMRLDPGNLSYQREGEKLIIPFAFKSSEEPYGKETFRFVVRRMT